MLNIIKVVLDLFSGADELFLKKEQEGVLFVFLKYKGKQTIYIQHSISLPPPPKKKYITYKAQNNL